MENKKGNMLRVFSPFLFILLLSPSALRFFFFFPCRNQIATYCNVGTFRLKKKKTSYNEAHFKKKNLGKPFLKMRPTSELFFG